MADDHEFGTFLRTRRERVSPVEVGLPAGGRRRTPGLRREELAMLAGISVDYLVRLEQGRDTSPSAAVVASLANVLRLTDDERHHAMKLVHVGNHGELCPAAAAPSPVDQSAIRLLDRLQPTPAYVTDYAGDILAWNPAYEALMRPTGLFDLDPPNLFRFTFLSSGARSLYPEWDVVARELVRTLRASMIFCAGDKTVEAIVGELSVHSPEFAQLWAAHDVGETRRGTVRLRHPVAGALDLDFEVLILSDPGEHRLVTYFPTDLTSAGGLDRVLAGEGPDDRRLRVVG